MRYADLGLVRGTPSRASRPSRHKTLGFVSSRRGEASVHRGAALLLAIGISADRILVFPSLDIGSDGFDEATSELEDGDTVVVTHLFDLGSSPLRALMAWQELLDRGIAVSFSQRVEPLVAMTRTVLDHRNPGA